MTLISSSTTCTGVDWLILTASTSYKLVMRKLCHTVVTVLGSVIRISSNNMAKVLLQVSVLMFCMATGKYYQLVSEKTENLLQSRSTISTV